ncbi:zinc-binding dehydrogenase [Pseudonocardia thermophila]|jgi:NADPH:quinone reductase and related Zn-dependent oxidoreductases|uniref:zinc-binding dehydrogenase n=1 Tax=Pseudonocardia thermophila TaxID=1848 RepID=UPI00248E55F5|nr:zinc-binding dehydrogenase [Pseudonocardia thermophila]
MRAIVQKQLGGPEVLELAETADPEPGPGRVRIAVAAAGVHVLDTALRRGDPPFPPPELPYVPGREVAGTVDAAGPDVDPSWIGRSVVAHLGAGGSGGYASLAVAAAESLHPLPDGLTPAAAVTMIGTGRTAQLLLDGAALTDDDVVLVTAAAGGLGTLLVQAARHAGARVVGLAGGPAKTERVAALGAQTVDYRAPGWQDRLRTVAEGATVAFDGVGGEVGRAVLTALRPGGRALVYGFSSGDEDWFTESRALRSDITFPPGLDKRPTGAALRDLETRALAAAADGTLVPEVTTFPLAEAAAAHRALESRATVGKVVLVP